MKLKSVLSPVRYRTESSAHYKMFYKNTTCVKFDLWRYAVNNIRVDNSYDLIGVIIIGIENEHSANLGI